ncbi:hypothetical protein [Glacieibacterium sp.]|uniref:hypothetical protein n=1 Tax=Glacieibacterium sp. TaxID=2860237 RepID=UPI003B006E98
MLPSQSESLLERMDGGRRPDFERNGSESETAGELAAVDDIGSIPGEAVPAITLALPLCIVMPEDLKTSSRYRTVFDALADGLALTSGVSAPATLL